MTVTVANAELASHVEARERRIRAEFPALNETVYLNTAAEGLGSVTLERALVRYAATKQRGSDFP